MNRHLPILVGCDLSAQQVSVADAKEADPGDVAFCWKCDTGSAGAVAGNARS
jgi:hypothetical protein